MSKTSESIHKWSKSVSLFQLDTYRGYHTKSLGDRGLKIPKNIAYEYYRYTEDTPKRIISIKRLSDIAYLEYLELSYSGPLTTFLTDIKNFIVRFTLGGRDIQELPLSLLMNLNEPIISGENVYINLCFDMLFGKLVLIGLQYSEVTVDLVGDDISCITKFSIVSKQSYVEGLERKHLIKPFQECIQQISFMHIVPDGNIGETNIVYSVNLDFIHISKGIFIECDNVNDLSCIKLKFNNLERFNLDRFLILTKCKKITQSLLYLPFNYNMDYLERTIESYEGSANLSAIDHINIIFAFEKPTSYVKIYNLYLHP